MLWNFHPLPDEIISLNSNTEFYPSVRAGVPGEPMDGKCIQQFVAKYDPIDTSLREILPRISPPDMSSKTVQLSLLPPSPALRRFEQAVIKVFIEAWPFDPKPCKYVKCQLTVMSSSFYKLNRRSWLAFDPLRELEGEQLTEQGPDANARIEVPSSTNPGIGTLVVSNSWAVKSRFHELRE